MTRPISGASSGPGTPDPDENVPHVTDKRRLDPHTFELRDADAAVLAEAESAASNAEEEIVLEGLIATQKLAAERLEELQRVQADLYNLDRRYSAYVKRSKAENAAAHDRGIATLAEALISVLDDIELARQHGELVGPFASIAEKFEDVLQRFGIERYGAVGETFDPAVHEALMHSHSDEVSEPTVQMVLQPGYRTRDRILRATRVAVIDPEGPVGPGPAPEA